MHTLVNKKFCNTLNASCTVGPSSVGVNNISLNQSLSELNQTVIQTAAHLASAIYERVNRLI